MAGVSIICFAASYAIAWALEISRLWFRSGVRGAMLFAFAAAGLLAHTIYLYYRAVHTTGAPLSSEQDWYMVAAWVLVVVYLYLLCGYPKTPFGLFLLPLALGLIGAGRFLADPAPFAREPASKVWGVIHGTAIVLATVSILVAFMAGVMYLAQARRLKLKRLSAHGPRLPSLEWLQRVNGRAIGVSMIMLALGVVAGAVLNLIHAGPAAEHVPWYDPVVLSTLAMLAWLVAATLAGGVFRRSTAGRRVAYLTLVSLIFLLLVLAAMLFLKTQHGGGHGRRAGLGIRDWGLESAIETSARFARMFPTAECKMKNEKCKTSANANPGFSFFIFHFSFVWLRPSAALGIGVGLESPAPSPDYLVPNPQSPIPAPPGGSA